ncbi:ABC transporter substrate-binding protein [Zophobihabitans entericus]|uniref:ABC transporter substrate-binding protein n=1 Tax=Zophobihabitans entericus TaxID=1635327 RepID=A0A6G9I814_9GAMM|nr:ABC transporter substrate-binding protein [Zophobihabitans entericus]QIQ20351.1 ABC transporter substrate-binding protein [Zophobihabitans entericus]
MKRSPFRYSITLLASLFMGTVFSASAALNTDNIQPESPTFKMGIQPWLGYGQWYVAQEKGLFSDNGLTQVEMLNFSEDKDINAALASGQIDGANVATHTAMSMVSAGLPVKIVLLLDTSQTADALIVDSSIKALADLKGKQVAYEEGTTSDILLRSAIEQAGLSWSDIIPVPMPAASAGSALIAKRVPAAVTYEPYLTVAHNTDPTVVTLFSGNDAPGIISDVFVVRDEVIEKRPNQVLALIKSWDSAVNYYNSHNADGRNIIAKGVGAEPEEVSSAFDGVRFYSVADNKAEFSGHFKQDIFSQILKAATDAEMMMSPVTFETVVDSQFVEAFK